MSSSSSTASALIPFSEATKVTRIAPGAYATDLHETFCVGSVPNGGYVASIILRAASDHLTSRGQPDTVTAHFEYINRTEVGPALIVVENVKLGRSFSTIHATLYQGDLKAEAPFITANSRRLVLAYFTHTNISQERGLTLETGWEMTPPSTPVADFGALVADRDPNWTSEAQRLGARLRGFSKASRNLDFYWPRVPGRKGLEDAWVRLASGERFDNPALGYIADALPYVVEAWRPASDDVEQKPFARDEIHWYPTLTMNLDVKRALPPGGSEWLFLRCMTREVRNGRMDLEAIILDQAGELVALASHANLVLGAARNLAKRNNGQKL